MKMQNNTLWIENYFERIYTDKRNFLRVNVCKNLQSFGENRFLHVFFGEFDKELLNIL